MNPIINPMWFYWIDILGSLKFWIGVVLFFSSTVFVYYSVDTITNYSNESKSYRGISEESKKDFKETFAFLKTWLLVMLVVFTLTIAIPSEKTFYKMMVAKYATSDNIDIVLDKITEGVDYIFDKIESKD